MRRDALDEAVVCVGAGVAAFETLEARVAGYAGFFGEVLVGGGKRGGRV